MELLLILLTSGVLQDGVVNGTYGSNPTDHRMTIVKDLTELPREQAWQGNGEQFVWQPEGGAAELSEVSCEGKSLQSIVIRNRSDDAVRRLFREGNARAFLTLNVPQLKEPPQFKEHKRMLLLYYAGLSGKTDGTQFIVYVNKTIRSVETLTGPGWRLCCTDLTQWAGETIALELCVANPSAWAAFGHPVLADVWGPYQAYPGGLAGTMDAGSSIEYEKTGGSRGLPNKPLFGLAQVDAFSPASIAISMSTLSWEEWNQRKPEPVLLAPGTHWTPLVHEHPTLFAFTVLSGEGHLRNLDLIPLAPDFPIPK